MLRTLLAALAIAMTVHPAPAVADGPAPLKVLFLGDRGHHVPADRAAQLIPVMAGRGIDVAYTEDVPAALNPSTLARYDALLVYANIDAIAPDQAKALLDYVANGGGFAPIHCASFCFRNNDAVVALIGAQFLRHGTGTFDTKVVDPDHPITRGLEPFRTWDETYVHTKHNPKDRHVLQVRAEGAGEEPWTWTRTHGKGRVFYTAYGHDARTWDQPVFHDLIERGLRWAANKGGVFDSRPRVAAGLKPFEYDDGAKIPLYIDTGKWGSQGDPITKMQRPIDPAESMKHMALPSGFEPKLFAAEPDIAKPIALAWDHRGRLWIAETTDYPNEMQPKGKGHDRIKICDDTDGDGKADKFTVFAENLSIPTSLAFARGGLIVHQAPDTLFLKDTDGDDKADERTVLFTGWGTRDTHAGPSNLRQGLDNWIYGIVGYSGFSGTVGGERHEFRQAFYRFKPDGSKLEVLRNTNNNSWGVGISEEGLLFGSTANNCPSVFVAVPNRYYESVRGWSPSVLEMISSSNRMWPITEKVRQVDWFGGFTAGAGHALYTARTYPKHYWNRTAFVAEPTGHLLATFTLHPKGSDFVSHNAWNLVASDDEWTSPIVGEVGPDGHVWAIDWYNFIVQHNPTPQGFQNGKGNAYVTPLRDKTHGRIYRIVSKDGKPSERPKLDANDPAGLVAALKNDNMLWRLHAQRLLVERGKADVVPALIERVKDRSVDGAGLNPGAIHAIWALQALGGSDPGAKAAIAGALDHPSAGVRRNAALALPGDGTKARVLAGSLLDADPQVRLAALLALADDPGSAGAGRLVAIALLSGRLDGDRWLGDAATAAAAAHDREFLAAVAAAPVVIEGRSPAPSASALALIGRVAEHSARSGRPGPLNELLASLAESEPRTAAAILGGVFRGWPKDRPAPLTPEAERALIALMPRLSPEARGQLATLGNRWGSEAFAKYSAEIATGLLATARDEAKPEAARVDAARQLVEYRPRDAATARDLLALISPRTPPVLAAGIVNAIGKSEAPEAGASVVAALPSLTPAVRSLAVKALLGRAEWTKAFLGAVEEGTVRLDELSLDQQQALASHPDSAIAAKAKALISRGGGLPDADRQKVIDALAPVVLKGGDPARGKLVFKEQCAKCHTHGGEGGKVGPDLTGMAAHPKAELLTNILDPSRSVEGNFVQYSVATTDGRTLNGLLASESKNAIEIVDAEGKSQKVLREEVEELRASKKSLMPEGFEKQVPPERLADLLAFLAQRGKYLPLDLRKAATVVSTKGMFYSETDGGTLIFPDWSPKTFEGVPFQLVDPQGDRVPNAILLYSPNGAIPPKMPRSASLPVNAPARAIHLLSGVSGWGSTGAARGTTSMIVRLHYADGSTEDHPLRDGVHFADYIRVIDVPGSKLAFRLGGHQVRYLSITPKRSDPIATVEFIKGRDATAPIVMAATVEIRE